MKKATVAHAHVASHSLTLVKKSRPHRRPDVASPTRTPPVLPHETFSASKGWKQTVTRWRKCRAWASQSASSSKHNAALLLQKKLDENGTDMGPWCAMDQTKHAKLLSGTLSSIAMRLEPSKNPQQHVMQSQSSSRESEHQGIRWAETA